MRADVLSREAGLVRRQARRRARPPEKRRTLGPRAARAATRLRPRALAQERIVDALLRALAMQQPELLNAIRSILTGTEHARLGKPGEQETVYQQIRARLDNASKFATAHGTSQE